MDTLAILEEKIRSLVNHAQKLQSEKNALLADRDTLAQCNNDLKSEHAKLIEENMRLQEKAKEAQLSTTKGNKQLDALNKEREMTKQAVNELIKSIDGIVNSEVQQ